MTDASPQIDLEQTLQESFGLERFRPGQREVIETVLAKRDVLCVMPTGGGKSLCYQLPALLMPGVTLVVSPLIALMKDQVDALAVRGLRATLINSTLDATEQAARLAEIEMGRFQLVYVAPERFRSGRFVEAIRRVKPALVAIDEAHCISEWGHDFRPDYSRLGQARRAMGMPPCIALTATATDIVRKDISQQLDLKDPAQFVTGFDRPNLSYRVIQTRRDGDKLAALAEMLAIEPGPAIVYASSRKRCEEVGPYVERDLRRSVAIYHAGLERDARTIAQDRFMGGEAQTVVATNAFGMGVDKADIRSVIHYNMPGTLEAYYQEAGRAGRDGGASQCVLLYSPSDRFLQEMFIENENPPRDCIFRVYEYLRGLECDPIELTQAEIKEAIGLDLNESAVGTSLRILEAAGGLELFRPRENMAIVRLRMEAEGKRLRDELSPQAQKQRVVLAGVEGLVGGRYGEAVYFRPDELAASLGLDRQVLTRALKALTADLPIDYVPPFRGNALRIRDRARRARELEIDFAALEKRKKYQYDKLDRMIKFAESSRCRREYILSYFGDKSAGRCGNCDNCGPSALRDVDPSVAIDTPAAREVIRKALSGVARAKGRFGKTTVAQMLVGSGAGKMDRSGLSRLSTFGILAEFKQAEVVQLLDACVDAGLLECPEVERFRPVVNLTATGWELIRRPGDFTLMLTLPDELADRLRNGSTTRIAAKAPPRGSETPESDPSGLRASRAGAGPHATTGVGSDLLRDQLFKLRTDWAKEAGIPPGYVFPNETMEILIRERPATPHALGQIKGIGPSKLERYGSKLLAVIASHTRAASEVAVGRAVLEPLFDESPTPTRPRSAPAETEPSATSPGSSREPQRARDPAIRSIAPRSQAPTPPIESSIYVPTEEWTCRLLDRGFSIDEAAAIRGLERSAIVRHATLAVRQGRSMLLEAILGEERLAQWDSWRREHGDAPPPAAGDLWAFFIACKRPDRA
jgi:ATP-dependent DNA helicase RecQ